MSEPRQSRARSSPRSSTDLLRLVIQEIIHHGNVMRPIIIWPRRSIAARDPHSGDARVGEDDAEEGQAFISRRGCDKAAVEQPPIGAEVLDQRTGFAVSVLIAGPAPIRQVHVREDRAEPLRRRRLGIVIGARHEEGRLGDVAVDGAKEPLEAERLEDGCIRLVAKGRHQTVERSLHKSRPRCGEEGATGCLEVSERGARDGGR